MIKKYTIYGERCSGTNYLENIMNLNFDAEITWDYGWKHFFGFLDERLKNSDDTLFICIIRNPVDWVNSFARIPHHIPSHIKRYLNRFLNNEFYTDPRTWNCKIYYNNKSNILGEDRNIYTGERYKNIFELRHIKLKWMIEELPKKVKNCILIKHEDLLNDFENTMIKLMNKGLNVKQNINFPINTSNYKNRPNTRYVKKANRIHSDTILKNPNFIPGYDKILYNI